MHVAYLLLVFIWIAMHLASDVKIEPEPGKSRWTASYIISFSVNSAILAWTLLEFLLWLFP